HARGEESADAADERMTDRRNAPRGDRDGVTDARSQSVDDQPKKKKAHGIRALKCRYDGAKLLVIPLELVIEDRFHERENLPVDVVYRRGEKKKGTDEPAISADWRAG